MSKVRLVVESSVVVGWVRTILPKWPSPVRACRASWVYPAWLKGEPTVAAAEWFDTVFRVCWQSRRCRAQSPTCRSRVRGVSRVAMSNLAFAVADFAEGLPRLSPATPATRRADHVALAPPTSALLSQITVFSRGGCGRSGAVSSSLGLVEPKCRRSRCTSRGRARSLLCGIGFTLEHDLPNEMVAVQTCHPLCCLATGARPARFAKTFWRSVRGLKMWVFRGRWSSGGCHTPPQRCGGYSVASAVDHDAAANRSVRGLSTAQTPDPKRGATHGQTATTFAAWRSPPTPSPPSRETPVVSSVIAFAPCV